MKCPCLEKSGNREESDEKTTSVIEIVKVRGDEREGEKQKDGEMFGSVRTNRRVAANGAATNEVKSNRSRFSASGSTFDFFSYIITYIITFHDRKRSLFKRFLAIYVL